MVVSKSDAILSSVTSFLSEKQSVASKEMKLVRQLNGVLRKMGYQVVPQGKGPARRKKRRRTRKARTQPKVVRHGTRSRRSRARKPKKAA